MCEINAGSTDGVCVCVCMRVSRGVCMCVFALFIARVIVGVLEPQHQEGYCKWYSIRVKGWAKSESFSLHTSVESRRQTAGMRKKKVCAGGDTRRLGCVLSCCQLRSYKNTFSALTWLLNSICLSGGHPPPPKKPLTHIFLESFVGASGGGWGGGGQGGPCTPSSHWVWTRHINH